MNRFARSSTHALVLAMSVLLLGTLSANAQLAKKQLDSLEGVGVDEQLNTQLPLDISFTNSSGKSIRIADLFEPARPILLSLNYSDCPMLCRLQLNGLVEGLRGMKLEPGQDFDVVSVSIDPKETPQQAREAKQNYVRAYGRPETANGWHFLSGDALSIAQLADAVGFRFRYVPERKEYAHAAVTIAVTPSGRVSRYLYGVLYPPQTLKLALVEAGEGKIGTTIDRVLLFCFHYDAATGRYAPVARQLMKVGATATTIVLALGLIPVWIRKIGRGTQSTNRPSARRQPYRDESGRPEVFA